MFKIQIVSERASKAEVFDSFEAAEAAGYKREGPDRVGGSQLRDELRGQPQIKGLCGPMWGGFHDAEGKSIYFKQNDKSDEVESYSPSKGPVAYHLIRYEDWESNDLLSR